MTIVDKLNTRMKELSYPDNHDFEVGSLLPRGILEQRIILLQKNAPEMFKNYDTFLDIGSNKGFLCFLLKDNYRLLTGVEIAKEICTLSKEICKYHNFRNVEFLNLSFEDMSSVLTYNVVYTGNVHHYLFREDILKKRKPLSFLHKLSKMTKQYLILDGCFEYTDFAVNDMLVKGNWSKEVYEKYTFENFVEELKSSFKLLRPLAFNGIGVEKSSRYTAVFERQ